MAVPIRWDNIGIPTFAGPNRAFEAGAKLLGGAFSDFGDTLSARDTKVTERNTDQAIAKLFNLSPDNYQEGADQVQASLGNRVDMARFLEARQNRRTDLFANAKAQDDYTFNRNFQNVFGQVRQGVLDKTVTDEATAANLFFEQLQPKTPEQATYIRSVAADLFKPTQAQVAQAAIDEREDKQRHELAREYAKNAGKGAGDPIGAVEEIFKDNDPNDAYAVRAKGLFADLIAKDGHFTFTADNKYSNGKSGTVKLTRKEMEAAVRMTAAQNDWSGFWLADPDLPTQELKDNMLLIYRQRQSKADSEDNAQKSANAAAALTNTPR